MADRAKVIAELDKLVDDVNPWKESPPLRCDIPYPLLCDALELLKEQEPRVIERVEDLYNEELYYMELIPHEPVNGMVPGKDHRLFPVVFYGFGIYHTVKNRCYIMVGAKNACETTHLQSRWPMNGYGVWWRCWTKKPTEEQMRAVKWNE